MKLWTVEVDGDWTDYADCFFTISAKSKGEAWKKAIEMTDKKIIRIFAYR